ncbi:MAG: hypothetical protein N838_22780 [Thiohalocapsa sp. PB-PSB1]|nr:MAG: hypothetical protein N838_22780 [Thiohalocapsa sp. PB-PSB1]
MKLAQISRLPDTAPKPPPLLFVHGAFTDARIWDAHFLPYFARQGYAAHAVSLRGHGFSEGHEQLHRWRLRDYVADLARTVADLPAPPVLIGHSMGGMVIQKYLETHPKIPAVALMASVPPQGLLTSNLHMAMRYPFLFQQMALFSLFGPTLGSPDMMHRLLFSREMPTAKLREYIDYMQAESQLVSLDLAGMDPLRLKPQQLQCPMLVQGAQQDVFISPSIVRQTARFYGSEAQIFPNMAHAMMLEENWREAADSLLHWLDQVVATHLAAAG